MMIIQYDLEDIDIAQEISEYLYKKTDEDFLFIPKNFWILNNIEPEYLVELRDKINEILEKEDSNE